MGRNSVERHIRAFQEYNQDHRDPAPATPREIYGAVVLSEFDLAFRELARLLASKKARCVYPFAPKGAKRSAFRLIPEAA